MPIYEYRCDRCRRRNSFFVRGFTPPLELQCSFCGATALSRIYSPIARLRAEEDHLEKLADPSSFADVDENDPRSVARWAKRMSREMGEDLGPEFDDMVEQMEVGKVPEELAGEAGGPEESDLE